MDCRIKDALRNLDAMTQVYDENADYELVGSCQRAAAFILACTWLIRHLPLIAEHGPERVQMNIKQIVDEKRLALAWWRHARRRSGSVLHSVRGFRRR